MPHVIDTLIVELNLDPSKFSKEQREVLDKTKKQVDQFKRHGDEMEDVGRSISEGFSSLGRKALGLFTVLTGARGLVDFAENTVYAGAAVGRLSRAIGVSATEISKWNGLAREFGGTPEAMANSFKALSDVFTAWQVGGPEAPGAMQIFRAINTEAAKLDPTNARIIDGTKGVTESYKALADNLKIIHDLSQDPNFASYLAGRIPGMDPALFDALIQGWSKLSSELQKIRGYTDEEAEAAGRLQRRWDALKVSAENLGIKALFGTIDFVKNAWRYQVTGGREGFDEKSSFTEPSVNAESVAKGFVSPRQREQFIRQEAIRRGVDPDVAMRVAWSEGFGKRVGDNGTSFGDFQLHVTPGGRGNAVGDQFQRDTGLDPRDPANDARMIQYALDWAKSHGWTDFHGAANSGIGQWTGIDRSSTSTSSSVTNINGPITINAGPNASAEQIASKLTSVDKTLRRQAEANQNFVGGQ